MNDHYEYKAHQLSLLVMLVSDRLLARGQPFFGTGRDPCHSARLDGSAEPLMLAGAKSPVI